MSNDTPKKPKRLKPLKPIKVKAGPEQTGTPGISLQQERLIGRVVSEWSKLEGCMNDLIWTLAGMSFEDGRVLTGRWGPEMMILTLRVLMPRYIDGERLTKIEYALAVAENLRDDRNFIVHGTWGQMVPLNQPMAMSIRAKSEPGEVIGETFPADRMYRIIRDILAVKQVLIETYSFLESSREKS